MSLIYERYSFGDIKRDINGKRYLLYIECDRCGARIRPNPKIGESGWTREITYKDRIGIIEVLSDNNYCPDCQ